MEHVVVTRFSVPRPADSATAGRHAEREWLEERFSLFRRFYVPSVGRLGVPAILLCSSESAPLVADALGDLTWARVVVQDSWYGGWTGRPDQVLTRLDSDDALHEGWFRQVEAADPDAEVVCSRCFLRLHLRKGKAYRYRRRVPSPLAAFRGGANPYAHDHEELPRHYRSAEVCGAYLLQVAHGGNLASTFPKPFRRRASLAVFGAFGLDPDDLGRLPVLRSGR